MATLSFRSLSKAPVILSLCASLMLYGCKSQEENNSSEAANTNTQNQIQVVAESAQLSESENLTLSFYDKDGKQLEQGTADCPSGKNSCSVAITNDQAWETVVAGSNSGDYYAYGLAGDLNNKEIRLKEVGYGEYTNFATRAVQGAVEIIAKAEGVFRGEADVAVILNNAKANWLTKAKQIISNPGTWDQSMNKQTACNIIDFGSPMRMVCFVSGSIVPVPSKPSTANVQCEFRNGTFTPARVTLKSNGADYFKYSTRRRYSSSTGSWSADRQITSTFTIEVATSDTFYQYRAKACNSYGCSDYTSASVITPPYCSFK